MRTSCYLGFISLLAFHLTGFAQVTAPSKHDLEALSEDMNPGIKKEILAARRALTEAPIVFLGRLLSREYFQDKTGRYYEAQVWQVQHVLRGEDKIAVGTVRMTEVSVFHAKTQKGPLVPPPPGKTKFLPVQAGNSYYKWAINFCRLSDLPASPVPYETTNPLTLVRYHPDSEIVPSRWHVSVSHGPPPVPDHGTDYCGFGFRFMTEAEMNRYLRWLPKLVPIPQSAYLYPKIPFVDARAAYLRPAPKPAEQKLAE